MESSLLLAALRQLCAGVCTSILPEGDQLVRDARALIPAITDLLGDADDPEVRALYFDVGLEPPDLLEII